MRVKDLNKTDLIFKASLEIIVTEGMAGLTMGKVAKNSGMATGTLYIYFKNKEELLNTLYLELREKSVSRFMKDYNPDEPFKVGFKRVWLNYLMHRLDYHNESIFLESYYRSPYIKPEQNVLAEAMKHPVIGLIRRGKQEMLIKADVDDEMLFLSIIGMIRELADEHVTKQYKLDNAKIESAFRLCWDMIKT